VTTGPGNSSRAREILAERLATGEVTPEEYRQRLELIGGSARARQPVVIVVAVLLIVGVVGAVAAAGLFMRRDDMNGMMGEGGMSEMMRGMNGMMGGESGRDGEEAEEGAEERQIEGDEFSFDPETIRLPVGETVNLVFENRGGIFHTLTIGRLNFELRAQAGETISGSLLSKDAGTFSFFCAVPGHAESGMRGKIVVEESGRSSS